MTSLNEREAGQEQELAAARRRPVQPGVRVHAGQLTREPARVCWDGRKVNSWEEIRTQNVQLNAVESCQVVFSICNETNNKALIR